MRISIAYSTSDPAGTGMARQLNEMGITSLDNVTLKGHPESVLDFEFLDERTPADVYIVLSKHRSAAGTPSLTVHHTGNPSNRADAGGQPLTLSIAHARLATHILRLISEEASSVENDMEITYEATHHGPTGVKKPLVFVEIGSTPQQWSDATLHRLMAQVVYKAVEDLLSENLTDCIPSAGFGGSHYPERFTRMALEGEYCFGHIIPKYAIKEGLEKGVVIQAIKNNAEPIKRVFMEKKAGPSPARRLIEETARELGVEFSKL